MSEETPEAKHSPATEQKNEIPQNIIPAHLVTANANANAAPSANSESVAKRMLADKWSVKIFVIILALLAFQLPLYMVRNLTQERKTQAEEVQAEIAGSWGGLQNVKVGEGAEKVEISAEVSPEIRYRGIYQAAIYVADIKIKAEYRDLMQDGVCQIKVSDSKGVAEVSATVNGEAVQVQRSGDCINVPIMAGNPVVNVFIKLRGSEALLFSAMAQMNTLALTGSWSSPGFAGDILPVSREIGDDKFSAQWQWNNHNEKPQKAGVELVISAGTYQQVERCFTYATFFLIIFFFTLLVGEFFTKINIHVVQYLVAAGAPVLFYLMTLAFSEKWGFTAGYISSAVIIVGMVTGYAAAFLGKKRPALIIGGVLAISYLFNFIILRMEDMALFSGTIVLALVLGVVMVLTGKINRNVDDKQ